jgi:hypothetical protein
MATPGREDRLLPVGKKSSSCKASAAMEIGLAYHEPPVAQVGNLLYRRLAVGRRRNRLEGCGLPTPLRYELRRGPDETEWSWVHDTADCLSALRFQGAIRVKKSECSLRGGACVFDYRTAPANPMFVVGLASVAQSRIDRNFPFA